MITYYAFIARSGGLVVRKYVGEHDRQTVRNLVRQEIGRFPATNIEQASKIALELKGAA